MVSTGRLAAVAALLALALFVPSAHGIPTDPDDTESLPACLHNFSVRTFGATPARVDLGESTTLAWRITRPAECANLSFTLNGQAVGLQGSRLLRPMANTKYTLQVRWPGQLPRTVGTATISVDLPDEVTIDADDQQPLFAQAVGTAGTTVRVANDVRLDLSGYESIPVAAGVDLLGGRSPRTAGGLLYTTTRPKRLLVVAGDDVRISGLRINGPDMGVADSDGGPASGVYVSSRNNVEIDHNEISGWKNAAVGVNDEDDRISYVLNPETVRVHDNFIHHNQRTGGFGYGVVIGDGAYALIDRNVFDYNRHAIASDGSDDSGYRAYENLVLKNGGKHRKILFKWYYTHQFDVHGQESCGVFSLFSDSLFNCGRAGHDVEIRRNSFLYTKDNAFKLRGTPQLKPHGAFVYDNVFAHGKLGDAVDQTESGMTTSGNRLGIDGSARLGTCDFDGDGVLDRFMATGQTWWYASRTGQWVYLGTSKLLLSQVTLGDRNGDGRCDVT